MKETYYYWTVLSHDIPRNKTGHKQVLAECVCGEQKVKNFSQIKNGYAKSCGCLRTKINSKVTSDRNKKHGLARTRLHNIWKNVRQRCSNPNASGYKNYGAKGVRMCEEWNDFLVFHKWAMEKGYTDELTLERKDSSSDYSPSNCEWITKGENISRRNKGLTGTGKTLRSKFTEQDIEDMKEMRSDGVTYEVIAGAFGSSISHVSRLIKGELKYYRNY